VRDLKLIVKLVELYDDLFSGKQTALVDVECTLAAAAPTDPKIAKCTCIHRAARDTVE